MGKKKVDSSKAAPKSPKTRPKRRKVVLVVLALVVTPLVLVLGLCCYLVYRGYLLDGEDGIKYAKANAIADSLHLESAKGERFCNMTAGSYVLPNGEIGSSHTRYLINEQGNERMSYSYNYTGAQAIEYLSRYGFYYAASDLDKASLLDRAEKIDTLLRDRHYKLQRRVEDVINRADLKDGQIVQGEYSLGAQEKAYYQLERRKERWSIELSSGRQSAPSIGCWYGLGHI